MEAGDIYEYDGDNADFKGSRYKLHSQESKYSKWEIVVASDAMQGLGYRVGHIVSLNNEKLLRLSPVSQPDPEPAKPQKKGWEPDGFDPVAHESFMKQLGG